jgi:hypothetical protein
MSNRGPAWFFLVALFIVLMIAAIVLLTVAIITHEEPGFIDGVPKWDRIDFPLNVCAQTYAAPLSADHHSAVETVISWANDRLGFEVFGFADNHCRVTVVIDAPIESGWRDRGGHSQIHHLDNRAQVCEVTIGGTAGGEGLTALVLYHEMGHCLGLAHDDYKRSIMYPERTDLPTRVLPPWISDSDRALLRTMYAPQ